MRSFYRLASAALLAFGLHAASADPANLFERRCTGCHELDQIRVGPRLRGVYGRTAGADVGFPYSEAMKAARIKWDETTLDKWLTDTESLIPGNDMAFRLSSAEERKAIIAYLRGLSDGEK